MKKKISIILMAISLCITVYATMFWQPSNENISKEKEESTMVFNNNVDGNNNGIGESDNSMDENKNTMDDVENLTSEITNSDIANTKEDISVETTYKSSIFKIGELEIEKSIAKPKKQRIEQIIKKMSSTDMIKLKDMFNNENKEVGFRDAFSLIKLRVSVKDYEEIKAILSEYIDFNVLDD